MEAALGVPDAAVDTREAAFAQPSQDRHTPVPAELQAMFTALVDVIVRLCAEHPGVPTNVAQRARIWFKISEVSHLMPVTWADR